MDDIKIVGMKTMEARHFQSGGKDANGLPPERGVSDGNGNPCRHCLQFIAEGDEMLIVSYRPFDTVQPYAEQGPVFVHARECESYVCNGEGLPQALSNKTQCIVRGYDSNERIKYGTGSVVPYAEIAERARAIFVDPDIEFVHVRSATNNCWQARIDRS